MMNYIKRQLSLKELENESNDITMTRSILVDSHTNCVSCQTKLISHIDGSNRPIENTSYPGSFVNMNTIKDFNQKNAIGFISSPTTLKEKSKILLIIDDKQIDWSKYFKNKKIFADYDILVEQAQFQEINLSAYSHGGILINTNVLQNGKHIVRSFCPDFVLVRQYVADYNVDWMNIILGMQYGAVPSINSMRALYNFRDKPWIFAELLKIQQRLGVEKFPLISQVYYPNHRKMFISPQYPSIVKIGRTHQGLGKIKIKDSDDYHDLTSLISISKCYSTIEPYIHGQYDVYIQKIGNNYKAFSRKSSSDHWKANIGSSIMKQIDMTERYHLWIDEVSQLFGGLDICVIEVIKSTNGKEYIHQINDCTMQLLNEIQEEDCRAIADLVIHKMQIYCRPDQQLSILTRVPSFDELSKLPKANKCYHSQNGNIRQTSNCTHASDTLTNLKKKFCKIFRDIPTLLS
ncbi:unnamed protein product [Rotaria magnacalcarata]|uniref:Synapsin n=2 Tax=Rotaria magnacalcarata TaxID=392030 RepID=A0A815QJZ5_9BILA|nr:unnamed protein product [Rotaria magnacalcarata]